MSTQPLLTEATAGALVLRNRMVMAPMTRNRAPDGQPSELMIEYYRQRASAGLIITEGAQIAADAIGYPNTPGIHDAEQVAGWRKVTDAVHAEGGTIVLQLWHTGRISHPSLLGGQTPVAPSAIKPAGKIYTASGMQEFVTPRALELHEIPAIVAQYRQAAKLAREAGFDGVEIHAANGYLIDQFLRDGTNHRTDEYGGAVENRVRFLVEVTEAVLQEWPAGRVGVRFSPVNPFNDIADSDPVGTFTYAAERMNRYGLAYLHVIDPVRDAKGNALQPSVAPALRRAWAGTFIVNGGYTRELGNDAIVNGDADLVAYGVPFLANPDLVERFALGASLNAPDVARFYAGGEKGYTDYPVLEGAAR